MQPPSEQRTDETDVTQRPGIIDTIGMAFALLNRRPYLVWLPVLADLLLWSGVRFRVNEPFGAGVANELAGENDSFWLVDSITSRLATVELDDLATGAIPTLTRVSGVDDATPLSAGTTVEISGAAGLFGLIIAAGLGLTLAAVYLTIIACLVREEPAGHRRIAIDAALVVTRLVGFGLAVTGVYLFVLLPFLVIGAGLALTGFDPTAVIVIAAVVFGLWLGLFFVFGVPALAVNQCRVIEAMRVSYQTVQYNLAAVLGLLAIALIIRTGIPYALGVFTETRSGVPFAIVANAYVMTGLIAAILLFFKQRQVDRRSAAPERVPAPASG